VERTPSRPPRADAAKLRAGGDDLDQVGHLLREVARATVGQAVRVLHEVAEDATDRRDRGPPLLVRVGGQVDALEHEGAEIEHGAADLLALGDLAEA
jgi:hypothetical protein